MKKIIISFALISTLAIAGCSHNQTQKNGSNKNDAENYNQIQFKCSAIKYREDHPFKTKIKDITKGDTLVFSTYGNCTAQMTTVINVDDKTNTFEIAGAEFKVKLKLNSEGKIIYGSEQSTQTLHNKYYVLGIIKAFTLFQQAN